MSSIFCNNDLDARIPFLLAALSLRSPHANFPTTMVLMPVKTAPGSLRAPRGRGINKSMKPRVQQLCAAIDSGHAPAQKQAVSELALLVACSANARGAIADPAVEGRLVQLLSATDDPTMLSWTISVLSLSLIHI